LISAVFSVTRMPLAYNVCASLRACELDKTVIFDYWTNRERRWPEDLFRRFYNNTSGSPKPYL